MIHCEQLRPSARAFASRADAAASHRAAMLVRALQPSRLLGAARSLATQAWPSFRAADLVVEQLQPSPQPPPQASDLPFGQVFTPHMLLVRYRADSGWGAPRIVPFGPLQLHPAAQVLHYGMTCFEGMKAYLGQDGRGRLFRPELNMARLARSAGRLLLGEFDPHELQQCIAALLRVDRAWLPGRPGHSMYIRPFVFSDDGALGVSRSRSATLGVIMSPSGPYFKSGAAPVRLFLDASNVRAWPGGAGAHKIGGNYAPTVAPQLHAATSHGCSQVVYALPQGPDPGDALISECGAMNMMFVLRRQQAQGQQQAQDQAQAQQQQQQQQQQQPAYEVVTPPLDGTILPGVTRDSILGLLRERPDVLVSERTFTVRELLGAHADGRLAEVFGCGTACVVTPVGCVVTGDGAELRLPGAPAGTADGGGMQGSSGSSSGSGSVAGWARERLLDIQYGRVPHPWSVPIE